jgi:hypothetical protein
MNRSLPAKCTVAGRFEQDNRSRNSTQKPTWRNSLSAVAMPAASAPRTWVFVQFCCEVDSLSELVAGGPLTSFRPRRCGLASAEMPRNPLSKGNDLIEGAMI